MRVIDSVHDRDFVTRRFRLPFCKRARRYSIHYFPSRSYPAVFIESIHAGLIRAVTDQSKFHSVAVTSLYFHIRGHAIGK